MNKQVIKADVPETGGPFNLCVRHGNQIYISGLPPFDADFAAKLREARARGAPLPPFPEIPFERQVRIVMDHLKKLVEAAGSNMDCLLKVIVWPMTSASRRSSTASIAAISAAPMRCQHARACRLAAPRWIVALRSRQSATCRDFCQRNRLHPIEGQQSYFRRQKSAMIAQTREARHDQ
jgi:enamine deaminase RidA (YjgF/YER057c/UK114 family)